MSALRRHRALEAIWGAPKGWRGTAVSVNHSDIGKRCVIAAFVFFAIGGVLAMMIRAQLATPGSAFVGRRKRKSYSIGSRLDVVVDKVDRYKRIIDIRPA